MLDIGRDDQVHPGQSAVGRRQSAEGLHHAAAAIGAAAATQPHDECACAAAQRLVDQLSDAPAVGGHRGVHGGCTTQQCQPACLRALDVGRGRGGVEYPLRVDIGV